MDSAKYPRLKKLLAELAEQAKKQGRHHTNEVLAERLGVARSAVYAWLSGARRPRPAQIDAIAEYFASANPEARPRLRAQLYDAVSDSPASAANSDPLQRAVEGSGPIRVGFVEFDPDGIDKFVKDLLLAFLDFLNVDYYYPRTGVKFADLTDQMLAGEFDIGVGHWQTPARLTKLRYIALPIGIGMNGIAYQSAREALVALDAARRIGRLVAVMHKGQAAYPMAQSVLRLPDEQIQPCDYAATEFVRIYNTLFDTWQEDRSKPIPIVLTDEVMCREIYAEMTRRHKGKDAPTLLWYDDNAIDLTDKDNRLLAAHPRYNVAFCVRRERDTDWYNFLEDSWRIFLRGNREFAGRLCSELEKHFSEKIEELASIDSHARSVWQGRCSRWMPEKDDLIDLHGVQIWRRIHAERREKIAASSSRSGGRNGNS
jgi:transcriptional regulator with XRE-family HTH domain